MSIEVRFWGTRGSIPTPGPSTARYGGNTSCVEVRLGDRLLIFDAGTGLRPLGLDLLARARGTPIDGQLFISHTHWDHIQGLPFFSPFYVPGHRFELYGPPGVDVTLERVIKGQMDPHYFPVDMTSFAAEAAFRECVDPVLEIGDVTIRTHYLHHTTLALGYRVEWGGRALVYATDHELYRRMYLARGRAPDMLRLAERHDAEFAEFVAAADLYIAEAQYTLAEYPAKIGWGHSTVEDIAELAATAGVRRLALYHHDPLRTDDGVEEILTLARQVLHARGVDVECVAAHEGMILRL